MKTMKKPKKFLVILLITFVTLFLFIEVDNVFAIANPSATYCIDNGYEYETRTSPDGGQYGVCIFPNGSECNGWDYYCNCTKNTSVCSPNMISTAEENCSYPCDCDPVDGGWSEWSRCDEDCTMSRTCTNPTPSCQGDPCEGSSSKNCTGGDCVVCGDSVCANSESVENCPNDCKSNVDNQAADDESQEDDTIEEEELTVDKESDTIEEEELTVDKERGDNDGGEREVISNLGDIPWWAWGILGVSFFAILVSTFVFVWRSKMKSS
jgi:hypothetical protein